MAVIAHASRGSVRITGNCNVAPLATFPALRIPVEGNRAAWGPSLSALETKLSISSVDEEAPTRDVEHSGGRNFQCRRTQRQREDGTKVILVLGGFAGFDGVMSRIMGARCDLIDVVFFLYHIKVQD